MHISFYPRAGFLLYKLLVSYWAYFRNCLCRCRKCLIYWRYFNYTLVPRRFSFLSSFRRMTRPLFLHFFWLWLCSLEEDFTKTPAKRTSEFFAREASSLVCFLELWIFDYSVRWLIWHATTTISAVRRMMIDTSKNTPL